MTLSLVLILVQLSNRDVMCDAVLHRGNIVYGYLFASILFKYESRMGFLFVLRWARVRRVSCGVLLLCDVYCW